MPFRWRALLINLEPQAEGVPSLPPIINRHQFGYFRELTGVPVLSSGSRYEYSTHTEEILRIYIISHQSSRSLSGLQIFHSILLIEWEKYMHMLTFTVSARNNFGMNAFEQWLSVSVFSQFWPTLEMLLIFSESYLLVESNDHSSANIMKQFMLWTHFQSHVFPSH